MTYLYALQSKVIALVEFPILKAFIAYMVVVGTFFFGQIYNEALVAIVMLMVFDTVLGMAASWQEGQPITSRKFVTGVIKGIVYFTAISAGYFVDQTVPLEVAQSTMIAFVGVTEFISILENVGRLGYQTPKKLLNQLREKYQ